MYEVEENNFEIVNKIKEKKKHKESVASQITELEKKKANLQLQEEMARSGESVELPDVDGEAKLEVDRCKKELDEKKGDVEYLEKRVEKLLNTLLSRSTSGSLKV